MVTRDTAWLPGTPSWVDMSVDDVQKAIAFYSGLFGWQGQQSGPEFGGYVTFTKDDRPVAGVGPSQQPGQPPAWTTYLASDDVERTAGKIKEAGGQVIVDPMAIGEFGRMVVAVDPGGAVFGVWQAGTHTGFGLANEPGSVTWNENLSRGDYETNRKFYTAVFGHEYTEMGEGDIHYATMELGGSPVGGIGEVSEDFQAGAPAHWLTYFAVADPDAAAAKATELGGRVVKEPEDSPYGRIAVVADDQGATFAVIGAQPSTDQ